MRVVRSAGQNVSPSDDGRLFDQIFTDGLFTDASITNLGANNVALSALYGTICGRDFTAEAQNIVVTLPEGDGEYTGYIYVEIDTSSEDVITINSALAPFTPTYEDINTNGAVVQMILAEYTATALAIQSITPVYPTATSGDVLPGSVATVESAQAVRNHSAGEYVLFNGQIYKVISAITAGQSLTPDTNIKKTSVGEQLNALNNDLTARTLLFSGYCAVGDSFTSDYLADSKILLIECNTNPMASSSRSRLFVPARSGAAYYTINVGGTVGYIRIDIDGNKLSLLSSSISGYCITEVRKYL